MVNGQTPRIRILLILDYVVLRAGLRMLLESQPKLIVVGEAATPREAIAVAEREQPDIILLELDPDARDSLDYIAQLRAAASQARVLLLNGVPNQQIGYQAVHQGVMGFVHKGQAAEVLFKAIEKVYAGEIWLDRATMANMLTEISRAKETKRTDPEATKIAALTEREREITALVGEGLKNKQIAERLSISEITVRRHLTSIYNKLDVVDRQSLMIYAYRHGLAIPPC